MSCAIFTISASHDDEVLCEVEAGHRGPQNRQSLGVPPLQLSLALHGMEEGVLHVELAIAGSLLAEVVEDAGRNVVKAEETGEFKAHG